MKNEPPHQPDGESLEASDLQGLDSDEVADHLFMHSVLNRMLGHTSCVSEASIEKAMQTVHAQGVGGPQSWAFYRYVRSRLLMAVVTPAAAILVIALILNMPTGTTMAATPLAIVQRALAYIEGSVDLQYRVKIDYGDSPFADMAPRDVTLHIGGADRFTAQMSFGWADLWMGHNGEDWWVVTPMPGAPVLVCDELPRRPEVLESRGRRWMDPSQLFDFADILTVSGMLRLLKNDYDLSLVTRESDGEERLRVHGALRTTDRPMPDEVELEADEENGVVRILVMSWNKRVRSFAPKKLILKFVGTKTLPENWYDHESHHPPAARVRRIEHR